MKVALAGEGLLASVFALAARAVPETTVVAGGEPPADTDLLVVATPPAMRADRALAATRGGAGALVVPPVAHTLRAADALVAAGEAGAYLAYGEHLVHSPLVSVAVTHARALDALDHVEVRVLQDRPTGEPAPTCGGVLFELGAHAIALALLLAGTDVVREVHATLTTAPDLDVDEHAVVELRFGSGLRGRIETSWRATVHLWDAQVSSAAGVVRCELLPARSVERDGDPVPVPASRLPEVPTLDDLGYVAQLEAIAADLGARRRPLADVAFGRAVLDITCAAYASAATGTSEPVPFRGERDRTPLELWRG